MSFTSLQTWAALHQSAIGDDRRGCEVTRPVSGEEGDYAGDLFRFRHSAQRDCPVQFGEQRGIAFPFALLPRD